MSPRDVSAELRASRPLAPEELRDRVLLTAERAPGRSQPTRRRPWRLALVAALAAAIAIVAAVVATRGGERTTAPASPTIPTAELQSTPDEAAKGYDAATPQATRSAAVHGAAVPALPPSGTRLQRYHASLDLRVPRPADVSAATRRALAVTRSLGGYPLVVDVDAGGRTGAASLTLRIPRSNVQEAVARLSALGTIVASNVRVEDLQAQVKVTDTKIERLQRRLHELRAQEQTDEVKRRIAAVTREVERLQRARAVTVRQGQLATVELHVATPQAAAAPKPSEPGPFHGLGVAFRWIGIGAVYAVALGAPLVLLAALLWLAARAVRRRREDALLGVR